MPHPSDCDARRGAIPEANVRVPVTRRWTMYISAIWRPDIRSKSSASS